jgi:hypothetical protein
MGQGREVVVMAVTEQGGKYRTSSLDPKTNYNHSVTALLVDDDDV